MPNQPQQLDPSIVRLAQAISKTETGGSATPYTQAGKSGEYGAYQYTAPTWAADSQKYLGQAIPLNEATPAQQDEVAYNKIKDLGTQGYTPAQIASIWNSGKPDPTGNVGVNKYGVAYDTPAYVSKVQKNYEALQGQSGAPQGQNQGQTPMTVGSDGVPVGGNIKSNLAALPGAVGGAINAAIPVVGDIGNALEGKNTKTAEQIGGDVLQSGSNLGAAASLIIAPELSVPALLGMGAGLGAAQSAGGSMQQNAPASQVVQRGAIGGAVGGATAGVAEGASTLLNKLAGKSVSLAVRPNAKDFSDGYDAQFALDNGLTGNAQQIAGKTKTFMQNLSTQLKNTLGNSDAGIDLAKVYDKTVSDLTSEEGADTNFLGNKPIKNALNTLQDEVLERNPAGNISLPRAQSIKQATGMYGEWANGTPDRDANALATVANTFYHNLKEEIENNAPAGVKEINQQLQKAIPIMRAAIRRIPVEERASALSMTDMLSVLGFPLNPTMAVAAPVFQHVMNNGVVSKVAPTIANALSRTAPATGAVAPNIANGVKGLLGQH